jgi:hypothetical protein
MFGVGEVGDDDFCVDATGGAPQRVWIAPRRDYVGTAGRIGARDGATEASAGTGDEGAGSVEIRAAAARRQVV